MAKFQNHTLSALLFIIPQLIITVVFFIWPACSALLGSFFFSDAFGLHHSFAGLDNFWQLLQDFTYLKAVGVTLIIALSTTILTMVFGLLVSMVVAKRTKTRGLYKSLLIWPYAVAPAVAGMLWRFLCHPTLGWLTEFLHGFGISFDYLNNATQALLVIIVAASWQQFSYNFIFYFAAIKAIPSSIIDAAIMDGASSLARFRQIIIPLLSPTTYFLLLMNLIYGFFDTFGIIQVMTHGGPGGATTNLIYKVYQDGFESMDLGGSAAQSVLLMLLVIALSLVQFKYLERKVHYE